MRLFFFYGATCALKVRLAIAELGLDVEECALTRADLTTPDYLRLNPKGVVPTLVVADRPIVESTTIMRFLSETAGGGLQPDDVFLRAKMNNWLKTMDEVLFPAIGYLTLGISGRKTLQSLSDEDLRVRLNRVSTNLAISAQRFDAIRHGTGSASVIGAFQNLTKDVKAMEQQLSAAAFLAGDQYSLADAAIAPIFVRLEEFGIIEWWLSRAPNTARWWEAVKERGSFARTVLNPPNPEAASYRRDMGELAPEARAQLVSLTAQ